MEQPFNLLAMRSEGWLKRLIYDPDAEGISHKQLQEALLMNFCMRAVIQGATELPGILSAIESGKTDAATIAYLEQQDAKISERLNQAMENFVEGKTPGAMGQTDLAVAEMDANTKASMGGNTDLDFQSSDPLAEALSTELGAEATAGDAADQKNSQADLGLEGFDTQNGKNPASAQNAGERGLKQAQNANNGPIVQDGSAETFGQIFGTQTDDGAKAQVSGDGQESRKTVASEEPSSNGQNLATSDIALSRSQEKAIATAENIIQDHLTESDFSGTKRDLEGNPVSKNDGGYWNHKQEMQDSYAGLKRAKRTLEGSLKNPNLSEQQRAYLQLKYDMIEKYIIKIEILFEPYGGIEL